MKKKVVLWHLGNELFCFQPDLCSVCALCLCHSYSMASSMSFVLGAGDVVWSAWQGHGGVTWCPSEGVGVLPGVPGLHHLCPRLRHPPAAKHLGEKCCVRSRRCVTKRGAAAAARQLLALCRCARGDRAELGGLPYTHAAQAGDVRLPLLSQSIPQNTHRLPAVRSPQGLPVSHAGAHILPLGKGQQ